jgi:hypothetical protein
MPKMPDMKNETTTTIDVKGAEGMFLAGMIGAFVVALASAMEFLRFFSVRLPAGAQYARLGLLLLGCAAVGIGFLAINKVRENMMAKITGFLFILLALAALTPLIPPVGMYGVYILWGLGAVTYGLGGLAVTQTSELWGKWGKVVSGGFFAVAAYQAFSLVVFVMRANLPGRVTQVVGIAFLLAQLAGLGAAGLSFMNLRQGKA